MKQILVGAADALSLEAQHDPQEHVCSYSSRGS